MEKDFLYTVYEIDGTDAIIKKKVNASGIMKESQRIELRELPLEKIMNLRINKVPALILKTKNKYWYTTDISKDIRLTSQNRIKSNCCNQHKCRTCKNLYPHKCSRVFDGFSIDNREQSTSEEAILSVARIEKYNYIEFAIETINVNDTSMIILYCDNYEKFSN